uniref:Prefoldin subunit 2 n=1 Tax=Sinocyclocheilus grahami TaxID=75366 RepID=A0A672RBI9_SINGR
MAANSSNSTSGKSGGKQPAPSAEQVTTRRGYYSNCKLPLRSLVIETLKEVDPSRKCFRLVGGVLVERTVKEVLPALENNKEQITKIVESLNTQMQAKGRELTEYRERYNIRLVGEDDKQSKADASPAKESEGGGSKGGAGVLVS